MFDFIRTHQRLMQFILLLLIFPSFAFFGLESYTRFRDNEQAVAKVAGQSIKQQEVDAAQRQQVERLRQMFGNQVDPKMFDTPESRKAILNNLIAEKALAAEARAKRLSVTDEALQKVILGIPNLTGPDGKFDHGRYRSLLEVQGLTPERYEAGLRQDLIMQQLGGAIQNTSFAPKTVAARLSEISDQEREVQELAIKASDFVSQVKVTDEMIKDYYDKNAAQFEIPEQVKADYAVLNMDVAAAQISVSDADVKSYYDQNVKRYSTEEQRRASHILIAAAKDAPAATRDAAKAKAQKILEQVRKNPADFEKLAKENSQDPESAERGGDLNFFSRGTVAAKQLEDAAFRLKQGETGELVESDFGYHIVKVTDIKAAATKPLDAVKDQIAAEIRKQLATKKFTELAETFSNTLYEQADSIKPAATKVGAKIETAANLTRNPNPSIPPTAPLNNPKFLAALFTDEVVKNKANTEAVEVAPNTLIAARIVEYKPVTKRPLDEVKAAIRERVVQTEAAALARKAGEAKLAEARSGTQVAGFGEARMVSRTKAAGLPGPAIGAVMKADTTKLPSYVGTEIAGQGYAIYRINKVAQPATVDENRRKAEQSQLASTLAQQEMAAYLETVKKKAKAEILHAPTPRADDGSGQGSK